MLRAEYNIYTSGNAPWLYPTDMIYGLLWYEEGSAIEIPIKMPFKGEWGNALTTALTLREKFPIPFKLDILWLSIIEHIFYEFEAELPSSLIEQNWNKVDSNNNKIFSHIVVGMAPYGKIAIWINGSNKSILISWQRAKQVYVNLLSFKPYLRLKTTEEYCNHFIDEDLQVKNNLRTKGLPSLNLFDKYMQQFTYRYLPVLEKWNHDNKWCKYTEDEVSPQFDYIEEALFDGTHDKLHDDGLLKYHEAGKPKKLAIKWHIKKTEYVAYFWFEDEKTREIFDRFYGVHPDTKTDFIIRIDAENKKYELALYRYGLKEPQVIPEDVYQLLVFKNKFEDYRSENYNQERGAWIW